MSFLVAPQVMPPLNGIFRPAVLANGVFRETVKATGRGVPLKIGLERSDGSVSTYETELFPPDHRCAADNLFYAKRAAQLAIQLPDEKNRRVGQAIAAASLPVTEA
jgi:hypothetical protein